MEATYKLVAIIEHFGSAFGGHYVAYKKLFPDVDEKPGHKNLWVLCDDSEIQILDQNEVL